LKPRNAPLGFNHDENTVQTKITRFCSSLLDETVLGGHIAHQYAVLLDALKPRLILQVNPFVTLLALIESAEFFGKF
jgi:hypothetical protein